jgi:hypothetical protein
LTGVKRLKKIVPEQIEPTALDQVLAREAHNLTNLFTMAGFIAMNSTVLANRFLLKGTTQSTVKSIEHEFTTLFTDRILVKRERLQPRLISGCSDTFSVMLLGTINRCKLQKDLKIFDLFAC